MFQDEARFGRINDPHRCWSPPHVRPDVCQQIVREYTYVYGAVCPADGHADVLILPDMTARVMDIFLAEVARRHPRDFIMMIYDGAPCHRPSALHVPANMCVDTLPPYSPQLNPIENLWDDLREKFFPNLYFDSMTSVEHQLVSAARYYESQPQCVKSITGFPWIISNVLNAN